MISIRNYQGNFEDYASRAGKWSDTPWIKARKHRDTGLHENNTFVSSGKELATVTEQEMHIE
jgi:hypothetical protein